MDLLWSASTTMRNPERAYSFLQTIAELDGQPWTEETQMIYQSLLIKNRFYEPQKNNLSQKQIEILEDFSYEISYEEAREIFNAKQYVDPPMRGRTSFDPLEKLGLVSLEYSTKQHINKIHITELGQKFLTKHLALEDIVFSNLLKFQYPNPLSNKCKDYNTKPFINTLRLIKNVNELCDKFGERPKGISKDEFGIFVLSIKNYKEVEQKTIDLLEYRHQMQCIENDFDKQIHRTKYIEKYLKNFKKPVSNTREYTDNIVRYLRLTKYIYIHGGGYYIDLEPRRMVEINALLDNDNGAAIKFTQETYKKYISDINAYVLPFETLEKLTTISENILKEINFLESSLSLSQSKIPIKTNIEELKKQIIELRNKRTQLQNYKLKTDYQAISKIDETIIALNNVRKLDIKPAIALEKWTNIAFNIINDAKLIKPNCPLGDDNEPTFTAPAGVPDIECYYNNYNIICEVTMLTGRNQWFNEGQPVMRHLREFENANFNLINYCLFIAPGLHQDTLNTFWTAVKYEYQGKKQNIIPITILQLIEILNTIKLAKQCGFKITQNDMLNLYNNCLNISAINNSTQWGSFISKQIANWRAAFIQK